jgi:2-amino-4-hydroxy-6-hydroxymethyldihydropteridine diphosphokinase
MLVSTSLEPAELLDTLAAIETRFGRVRDERWGDRTLDIDILTFGDRHIDTDRLTIPHPRAWERAFVLAPWVEIEPDAVIPGRGPIVNLLAACGDSVQRYPAGGLL